MKRFESDKAMVAACLKYDPDAQRALYDKYVNAMYNTVYRYTFNHHDTQDILQNGFTRVFKHLKKFDSEKGNLLSWMRRIHIHCALDFLKKQQISFDGIADEIGLTSKDTMKYEELEAEYILKLIEELKPRDRVIFNMYHIEGYSHQEIAEFLTINVNSSRVYLARAKKILRDKINVYNGQTTLAQ